MSPVLLGLRDQLITPGEQTSWSTNKIGGLPDWMTSDVAQPLCQICHQPLNFVGQLYSPLSCSDYHRTLYIFVCHRQTCVNQPNSWMVLRSQIKVDKANTKNVSVPVDDWGVAADEWSTSADDWDSECSDSSAMMPTESVSAAGDDGGTDVDQRCSDTVGTSDSGENCSSDATVFTNNTPSCPHSAVCDDVTGCLQQMLISDVDSADSDDHQSDQHVIADDTLESVLSNIKHNNSLSVNKSAPRDDSLCQFDSYYVNVIDEPEGEDHLEHEKQLLREYAQQQGISITDLSVVANEGGGVEHYEKSSVKHGDRMFLKFCERMSRCSQQLIRYCYSGQPLYSHSETQHVVLPRCHCGANRVFELQLMPALVHLLCQPHSSDPVVEFQSILVFTCLRSCWTDGNTLCEEFVIVESDADEHLIEAALSRFSN